APCAIRGRGRTSLRVLAERTRDGREERRTVSQFSGSSQSAHALVELGGVWDADPTADRSSWQAETLLLSQVWLAQRAANAPRCSPSSRPRRGDDPRAGSRGRQPG